LGHATTYSSGLAAEPKVTYRLHLVEIGRQELSESQHERPLYASAVGRFRDHDLPTVRCLKRWMVAQSIPPWLCPRHVLVNCSIDDLRHLRCHILQAIMLVWVPFGAERADALITFCLWKRRRLTNRRHDGVARIAEAKERWLACASLSWPWGRRLTGQPLPRPLLVEKASLKDANGSFHFQAGLLEVVDVLSSIRQQ